MSKAESPAKHTPGPWKASPVSGIVGSLISCERGNVAAVMPQGTPQRFDIEQTVANARLIAAAPELLEALKRIVCSDCRNGVLYRDSLFFDLEREDDQQQCPNCAPRLAAIAKAESGEPTAAARSTRSPEGTK